MAKGRTLNVVYPSHSESEGRVIDAYFDGRVWNTGLVHCAIITGPRWRPRVWFESP
jgi:hypothetical protein